MTMPISSAAAVSKCSLPGGELKGGWERKGVPARGLGHKEIEKRMEMVGSARAGLCGTPQTSVCLCMCGSTVCLYVYTCELVLYICVCI